MISSIRTYLLINLLLSVTLITSLAIVGSLFIEHKNIQAHLDAQLTVASEHLKILIDTQPNKPNWKLLEKKLSAIYSYADNESNISKQLQDMNTFQVWGADSKLLMHSGNSPITPLSNLTSSGLNYDLIHKTSWRTSVLHDKERGYTIIVAQPSQRRQLVANKLTQDSIYILLITYPILGFLIWMIVGKALAPVSRITGQLRHRKAAYLEPVDMRDVPSEVKPLVNELNSLFVRLSDSFEREKRFAGDAAHELRTPLAVMSAQTQVAMRADDPKDRKEALKKLLNGVERSSHIIHQLLTMSRMAPQASLHEATDMDLTQAATDTISDLIQSALNKNIDLGMDAPEHLIIQCNNVAIAILLRNIVDNAIRYTPDGGVVSLDIKGKKILNKRYAIITVTDTGPGIPEELRERVFERFFRVVGNKAQGSGLGLGIVKQIVALHGGSVELNTPAGGKGLEIKIKLPCTPKIVN